MQVKSTVVSNEMFGLLVGMNVTLLKRKTNQVNKCDEKYYSIRKSEPKLYVSCRGYMKCDVFGVPIGRGSYIGTSSTP